MSGVQVRPDGQIFAETAKTGEVVPFPAVSRGWGITIDQTGGFPPMEWFNWLGQRTDQAVSYYLQRGIPEWSTTETYPLGACTQVAGKMYKAKRDNTGKAPASNAADWDIWALTQSEMDARYGAAGSGVAWTSITGKPTTVAGYGITDAEIKGNCLLKAGDTASGSIKSTVASSPGGAFWSSGDIGGIFESWTGARAAALEVEAPVAELAYAAVRWTRYGDKHFAAIDATQFGGVPVIVLQLASRQNAWKFDANNITRGDGLVAYGQWNFNPAAYQLAGNYQPAGNYLVVGGQNSTTSTVMSSGAPPSIAAIDSSGNSNNVALEIQNGSNNSASSVIGLHRVGAFGCFFGLDTDNQLKVGGRSMGPNAYRIWHEGNLSPGDYAPSSVTVQGGIGSTCIRGSASAYDNPNKPSDSGQAAYAGNWQMQDSVNIGANNSQYIRKWQRVA